MGHSSEDALWVPKFYKDGLIDPFAISRSSRSRSSSIRSRGRSPFWKDGRNQMGYPFGWSTVQIYYNPKFVTTKPDSWHALLDPKYKGKIVVREPADRPDGDGRARDGRQGAVQHDDTARSRGRRTFLKQLKPNFLKLVSQNTEVVRALTDGSAWIGSRTSEPTTASRPRAGRRSSVTTRRKARYGWIDGEQMVKASKNARRVLRSS